MKMKRAFSLFLAAVLVLSILPFAFAEDADNEIPVPQAGLTLRLPEAFHVSNGVFYPVGGMEIDDGIYYVEYDYYAMAWDELNALYEKEDFTEEDFAKLSAAFNAPFMLLGIDGSRDFSAINELFDDQLAEEYARVVYQEDDLTYYLYEDSELNEAFAAALEEPYAAEYAGIIAAIDEFVANSDFYRPVSMYDSVIGETLSFTTTDTEGNSVTSGDLFGAHRITMVNIWASWCGPCIRELPELEAINSRLAELDCAVVGLLYDGDDPDALKTAKGIMEENGVTYTVILPPENVDSLFPLEAYPTSYFVSSDGRILGEPVVGAYTDRYEEVIQELLAEEAEQ